MIGLDLNGGLGSPDGGYIETTTRHNKAAEQKKKRKIFES